VLESQDRLPTGAEVFREGLLLSFARPLDRAVAVEPNNYRVGSWDYLRSKEYGSSYFQKSGTPGVDERKVHAVLLAEDRRSVFVALRDLDPAMQIELQYRHNGEWKPVYFTAYELPPAALAARGFGAVDLASVLAGPPAPRDERANEIVISEARGQQVATMYGCVACHSLDGSTAGKTGPSWKNIHDRLRTLSDGTTVRADDAYLREAILEPAKKILKGYENSEAGMPPYAGVLSDPDVESLILYIRSLK
jgi:mono/diheme cytochrome c family protein